MLYLYNSSPRFFTVVLINTGAGVQVQYLYRYEVGLDTVRSVCNLKGIRTVGSLLRTYELYE